MTGAMIKSLEEGKRDYVIIGTGMGGATLGYALAKAGKSVLFCERGRSSLKNLPALRGTFAESCFPRPEPVQAKHAELLIRAGRYSLSISDCSTSQVKSHIPFLGAGTGGSTALYGMALERFFPADFIPRCHFPEAGDSTLPDRWPITYDELRPFYQAAEQLYRVHGEFDPCRKDPPGAHLLPPPPLSPVGQELSHFLSQKGLHPYRVPLACEFVHDCRCCQGYLCAQNCKNDAARICLQPAIEQHGAELLDECEVIRLDANTKEVTAVHCRYRGVDLKLRAPLVIVAAGGIGTPYLLLNSASEFWPTGLANRSGLVGRNLMRHYVDLYLVRTQTHPAGNAQFKELAFNDLYYIDGQKYGTVQSFGSLPPVPYLLAEQERELREGAHPWRASLFKLVKPLVRPIFARFLSRRNILASIQEDLPYRDNRVSLRSRPGQSSGELQLEYRIRDQERRRIDNFRTTIAALLDPYRVSVINQAENNERLAHVCGTCRFGHSPDESVLNPFHRAHDLENLYVADASCFPSSGGTNPALTIAALALRLAGHLLGTIGGNPGIHTGPTSLPVLGIR